ncbi:MAG TPA: response regulator [Candidatus Tenderia sp.]|nr:response regulator [Candidatus Tenderia sp.]
MEGALKITDLSISVVEPSSTQWRIIKQQLNYMGVTNLDHFVDGQSAINDMHGFQPDLVISAMHLPDMTGTKLVQGMRNDPELESVPFMIISSENSDYYLEPIRQAGVIAILPKPFNQHALKKALYSTLEFIEPDLSELADIDIEALNVLVVDDSSTARKHISRVLGNLGIEKITLAENGKEAVAILEGHFFDLIVTDYNMPEMDGKELAEYVRQKSEQRSIPILMVTSEASHSHLAGVKQSGVSAMCDKPFEPNEVKTLIRKILSSPE